MILSALSFFSNSFIVKTDKSPLKLVSRRRILFASRIDFFSLSFNIRLLKNSSSTSDDSEMSLEALPSMAGLRIVSLNHSFGKNMFFLEGDGAISLKAPPPALIVTHLLFLGAILVSRNACISGRSSAPLTPSNPPI